MFDGSKINSFTRYKDKGPDLAGVYGYPKLHHLPFLLDASDMM